MAEAKYQDGNAEITIKDDCCVKTAEEVEQILKNIAEIYVRAVMKKAMEDKTS